MNTGLIPLNSQTLQSWVLRAMRLEQLPAEATDVILSQQRRLVCLLFNLQLDALPRKRKSKS